jgi:hypothetical protein
MAATRESLNNLLAIEGQSRRMMSGFVSSFMKNMMDGGIVRDFLYWVGSWGLMAGLILRIPPINAMTQLVHWLGIPIRWIPDVEGWIGVRSWAVFCISFAFFAVGAIVWTREEVSRDKVLFVEVWSLLFMFQSHGAGSLLFPVFFAAARIAFSWALAKWADASYCGFYRGLHVVIYSMIDTVMAPVALFYFRRGDRVARVQIEGPISIEELEDEKPIGAVDISEYARK